MFPTGAFNDSVTPLAATSAIVCDGKSGGVCSADGKTGEGTTVEKNKEPEEPQVTATIDCTGVVQFNKDRFATVVVKYGDIVRKVIVANPNPLEPEPEPEPVKEPELPVDKIVKENHNGKKEKAEGEKTAAGVTEDGQKQASETKEAGTAAGHDQPATSTPSDEGK